MTGTGIYEQIQAFNRTLAGGITTGSYNGNMVAAAQATLKISTAMTADEAELRLLQTLTGDTGNTLPGMRSWWPQVLAGFIDMNFAGGTYGPAFITCTRASTEYGLWADGHLSSFANNVPVITDLGLASWQAATNLALQSQTLDNASWSVSGAGSSVSADTTVAPDGTTTADTITSGAVSSAPGVRSAANITLANSTAYSISVYVNKGTGRWLYVGVSNLSTTSTEGWFDLQSAAVGTKKVTGTGWSSADTITLTALGSGWYRATLSSTTSGSAVASKIALGVMNGDNSTTGAGATMILWGVQVEASALPTPYIPTTTVAVARSADVNSLIGAAATAALAAKAARVETNGVVGGTSPRFFEFAGFGNAFFPSSTTVVISDTGSGATATIGGAATYTSLVKTAFGFDSTSVSSVANGGTKVTDANPVTGHTGTIVIGNRAAGDRALNGYLRRLTFGPTKGQFDLTTI